MGMYCACGMRRNTKCDKTGQTLWDVDCTCDLTGFVKHRERLPEKDGVYEVRCQSDSCDIYHEKRWFSVAPRIVKRDGYFANQTNEYHWSGESWDGDQVLMWREILDEKA